MSPGHRDWVSRLRYVILDEIHCIGEGDEEGRAWERLVQLMPCPFIALSATVGNPESFHHWLGSAHISGFVTRHDHKRPVEIIQFAERYADLSTSVYSPDILVERSSIGPKIGDERELEQLESGVPQDEKATDGMKNDPRRAIRIAGGLFSLNPFVCLTYKQVITDGIRGDFYVPSADLLQVSPLH